MNAQGLIINKLMEEIDQLKAVSREATNHRIVMLLDQAAEQRREFKDYRLMATMTENRLKAIIEDQQAVIEAARVVANLTDASWHGDERRDEANNGLRDARAALRTTKEGEDG